MLRLDEGRDNRKCFASSKIPQRVLNLTTSKTWRKRQVYWPLHPRRLLTRSMRGYLTGKPHGLPGHGLSGPFCSAAIYGKRLHGSTTTLQYNLPPKAPRSARQTQRATQHDAIRVRMVCSFGTSRSSPLASSPHFAYHHLELFASTGASNHFQMSAEARRRVVRRVTQSGALPVSRDAPGYAAVLKLLGVVDSGTPNGDQGRAVNVEPARAGEPALYTTNFKACYCRVSVKTIYASSCIYMLMISLI